MSTIALAQTVQITQATVIAILAASTVVVVSLIALIAYFASRTPLDQEGGPLHFGNFFVVSLGIVAALIGFLIAFPLVVSGVFADPTQVIALLSGLFGTIVGLVGTYFGIKSSGDASQKAQELARAMAGALPDTTPDGTGPLVDKKPPPEGATSRRQERQTVALARNSYRWHHSFPWERLPRSSVSGRKEAGVPLYMTQFAYTPEAWAALTRNPEDRSEALRGLMGSMGGRLISYYYSFGEYDGVIVFEAPDDTAAAAGALAAVTPGHLKTIKTTPLLSIEDAMEAMRKAGEVTLRRPGQE